MQVLLNFPNRHLFGDGIIIMPQDSPPSPLPSSLATTTPTTEASNGSLASRQTSSRASETATILAHSVPQDQQHPSSSNHNTLLTYPSVASHSSIDDRSTVPPINPQEQPSEITSVPPSSPPRTTDGEDHEHMEEDPCATNPTHPIVSRLRIQSHRLVSLFVFAIMFQLSHYHALKTTS